MIIKVTMETPDAMSDAIKKAAFEFLGPMPREEDARFDWECDYNAFIEKQETKLRQWFRWGEYLDIEFDTVLGIATVREHGN